MNSKASATHNRLAGATMPLLASLILPQSSRAETTLKVLSYNIWGGGMNGRTPRQAFIEGLPKTETVKQVTDTPKLKAA
jgi:hypothetical protein